MELRQIELSQLECDQEQIRRKGLWDSELDGELASLAFSIGEVGLVNPIIVKEIGPDRFMVVAGERRLLAARIAKCESIPCLVLDKLEESLDYQLAENFHRKDLDPLAKAYVVELLKQKHIEEKKVSQLLGVSPATITQWTKILDVDPKYQEAVIGNFYDKNKSPLTIGHLGVVVVKGFKKETICEVLDLVMEYQLSREKTEQLVKVLKSNPTLKPADALKKILNSEIDSLGSEDEGKEKGQESRKRFVLVIPNSLPEDFEMQEELKLKFMEHLERLDRETQRLFGASLDQFLYPGG
jgi:ParB family chromosome partitioning protein